MYTENKEKRINKVISVLNVDMPHLSNYERSKTEQNNKNDHILNYQRKNKRKNDSIKLWNT